MQAPNSEKSCAGRISATDMRGERCRRNECPGREGWGSVDPDLGPGKTSGRMADVRDVAGIYVGM